MPGPGGAQRRGRPGQSAPQTHRIAGRHRGVGPAGDIRRTGSDPRTRLSLLCNRGATTFARKDARWPDKAHQRHPSVFDDEDSGSGRGAVRIASVAALGGLLFGYDSAVINGAVDAIQKHFEVNNASLGFAVASALLGRRRAP